MDKVFPNNQPRPQGPSKIPNGGRRFVEYFCSVCPLACARVFAGRHFEFREDPGDGGGCLENLCPKIRKCIFFFHFNDIDRTASA